MKYYRKQQFKSRVPEAHEGHFYLEFAKKYDQMTRDMLKKGYIKPKIINLLDANIRSGNVLEIGSGTGIIGLEWLKIATQATLHGLELNDYMIALSTKNAIEYNLAECVTYVKGNAESIPFRDHCFDGVFSNSSLHEWDNPPEIFNEIQRVLLPGGNFCIIDLRRDIEPYIIDFMLENIQSEDFKNGFIDSLNAAYTKDEVESLLKKSNLMNATVRLDNFGLIISGNTNGN